MHSGELDLGMHGSSKRRNNSIIGDFDSHENPHLNVETIVLPCEKDDTVIASAFKGIKIAVGILILDAAITMIRKMHKKVLPHVIMLCSFATMLLINIFAWNFSSISLMLIAAAVSLTIFCIKGAPDQKGGAKK